MDPRHFRRLLRLYPPAFRRDYGEPMLDCLKQVRADAESLSGLRRAAFTARLLGDFLLTAGRAWLASLERRPRPRVPPTRSSLMDRFSQDLRFALRTFAKRPAFTAIVIATLALGIGANTAIFTLVNEIVLRPLPIGEPSRVVDLVAKVPGGNSFTGYAYSDYLDYRDRQDVLSGVATYTARGLQLGPGIDTERIIAQFTSLDYFDVVDVQAARGRTFGAADAATPLVVVISHDFWQRRLGGDPGAVGKTLILNGTPATVIGIGPAAFTGTFVGFSSEIWLPLRAAETLLPNFVLNAPERQGFEMIGRLADGVTQRQAQAGLDVLAAQLEEERPDHNKGVRVGVVPTTGVDHSMRAGVLAFLGILMGVAGLVLLITCLNVGSLLLSQAAARRKEMSIRFAMGAGAGRVARQLLTEVVVLFLAGGALGAFVASQLTAVFVKMMSSLPMSLDFDLGVDWRVLLFTAGAALLTSLLAGVFPIREAVRHDLIATLRVGTGGDGRRSGRLRRTFVVAQVAGAVTLLVGAGLFLRSLQEGMTLDPGFEATRVASASFLLPDEEYDMTRGLGFQDEVASRVARLPGVEAVTVANRSPIDVEKIPVEIELPGRVSADGQPLLVDSNRVGAGFFTTLGISLIAGRDFEARDAPDSPRVAIVNATFAERFWPGESVVGQRFQTGSESVEIVGVAADSRTMIQSDQPDAYVYFPVTQDYASRWLLLIRAADDPQPLWRPLRQEVAALDAGVRVRGYRTLRELINVALLPQRVAAAVTLGLGAFALLLASMGIYGVLAHSVGRRTREIGIRIALGGRPGDVVRLIASSGLRLVAIGVFLGIGLALLMTPLLRSFLVGVEPGDPWTVAAVVVVFFSVSVIASYLPARRAVRIDPTSTLRSDL